MWLPQRFKGVIGSSKHIYYQNILAMINNIKKRGHNKDLKKL
ncbi:hypothetical protein T10_6671 [Trichinella papuae]|uniref:Uncharacterized protein n=1 Tax=Trichinella papuae TaxID=268474 RepID=A0A0V1LXR1_9BILA|nr:hypothetical protein T10_6671 [Trichinella papuae]